ncbi:MAG: hypothetical protein JO257_07845, partial [Deltaproteobacteria bacterium]|nr:hypothetical protein [Deltaproteobacteria bacterium]
MNKLLLVAIACAALVSGCKKKKADDTAMTTGSGSAMVEPTGSNTAAVTPTPDTHGPVMGSAEGSATNMGVGSGGSDVATTTGSAGATDGAQVDPEGHRNWDCKAICKRAVDCKATSGMDSKACVQDCDSLAKDKDGRYARGAGESARFYTCVAKAVT